MQSDKVTKYHLGLSNEKRSSKAPTVAITYAILISLWFVSWLIVGDGNWWLVLLNRIVPYLFIPAPLLLFWSIRSRHIIAVLGLILPCLIFAWIFHPYLYPRVSMSKTGDAQLRVMTYNVLFSNNDYDSVAEVILAYEPDFVALQEVKVEMMNALNNRLSEHYPYSVMGTENEFGTTAVFSKHAIIDHYILDLHADRPAIVMKAKAYDQQITFVSIHLRAYGLWWVDLEDLPEAVVQRTAEQNKQVSILLENFELEEGVVVIGCDCNSYETSSSYRILARSMSNMARETGWFLPTNQPSNTRPDTYLQHIDYIWYRGSLTPIAVYKVNDSGGSDHLPVLGIFGSP